MDSRIVLFFVGEGGGWGGVGCMGLNRGLITPFGCLKLGCVQTSVFGHCILPG